MTETWATFPRPCEAWGAAPASAPPTSFPLVWLQVAKAERPTSSTVPDGSAGAASAQGEPRTPDLPPDTEVPALVGPPLPDPEREKSKTQRPKDLSPASKSWSWAALEGPAPPGPPEGFSRRKGE